jgi:signal transduction histidine kinase
LARQQLLQQQQHKRLARRIHDDISQSLTLLSLQLSLAQMDAKPPVNWPLTCKKWSDTVLQLGQKLRDIINELQPRILDELGLVAALQRYAHSPPMGIACRLVLHGKAVALPPSAANELFSICRDVIELVLVQHGVTEVTIQLEHTHDLLRLHLRADEKSAAQAPVACKALDALSIHERLSYLDGSVEINQEPDQGLALILAVPFSRQPVSHAA